MLEWCPIQRKSLRMRRALFMSQSKYHSSNLIAASFIGLGFYRHQISIRPWRQRSYSETKANNASQLTGRRSLRLESRLTRLAVSCRALSTTSLLSMMPELCSYWIRTFTTASYVRNRIRAVTIWWCSVVHPFPSISMFESLPQASIWARHCRSEQTRSCTTLWKRAPALSFCFRRSRAPDLAPPIIWNLWWITLLQITWLC